MARRERFFTLNWAYLAAVISFGASAWLSEGPLFVAAVGVIAVAVIAAYYAIWRWLKSRST